MIATGVVNITINGRQIHARAGQTVLEAAAAAGIDIPALCYHPALPPEGACRVCLVEIKDQRTLQPACTFPVFDGMAVQTETERVVAARVFALQMIFSERSHYCMFCPAQRQRQQHGLRVAEVGLPLRLDLLGACSELPEELAGGRHRQVFCHRPRPVHPLPAVRPGVPRDFRQPHVGRPPARCADHDRRRRRPAAGAIDVRVLRQLPASLPDRRVDGPPQLVSGP